LEERFSGAKKVNESVTKQNRKTTGIVARSGLYVLVAVMNMATNYMVGFYLARTGRLPELGMLALSNSILLPLFQLLNLQIKSLILTSLDDEEVKAIASVRIATSISGLIVGSCVLAISLWAESGPSLFIAYMVLIQRVVESLLELLQAMHQRVNSDLTVLLGTFLQLLLGIVAIAISHLNSLSLGYLLLILIANTTLIIVTIYLRSLRPIVDLTLRSLFLVLRAKEGKIKQVLGQSGLMSLSTVLVSICSTIPRMHMKSSLGATTLATYAAVSYLAVPFTLSVYAIIPLFAQRRVRQRAQLPNNVTTVIYYSLALLVCGVVYSASIDYFSPSILRYVFASNIAPPIPHYCFIVLVPLAFQTAASVYGELLIAQRQSKWLLAIGATTLFTCVVYLSIPGTDKSLILILFCLVLSSTVQMITALSSFLWTSRRHS
jgi:hypothetical protein